MTFEKWLEMAILYGSDPDNENQVAIGSRLWITVNTVNFAYFVFSRFTKLRIDETTKKREYIICLFALRILAFSYSRSLALYETTN